MILRLSILFVVFFFDILGNSIEDVLKEMPSDHKQSLEYLFANIFLQQDGSYVIFGDKPVSTAASFLVSKWESVLRGHSSQLAKSWEIWQKYKDAFSIKNYLIISEIVASKKYGSTLYIYVINKRKFIDIIYQNLSLFKMILSEDVLPEKILNDIETGKASFMSSFHNNPILFGILLGFGKHNSLLYQKSSSMRRILKNKIKLESFCDDYYPLMKVNRLQFLVDQHHPETILLQAKYKALHEKISQIYIEGDLLTITLLKLTE